MNIGLAEVRKLRGDGIYLGFNMDFNWKPESIYGNPLWTFLLDIDIVKINLSLELHGKYLGARI